MTRDGNPDLQKIRLSCPALLAKPVARKKEAIGCAKVTHEGKKKHFRYLQKHNSNKFAPGGHIVPPYPCKYANKPVKKY